MTDSRNPPLNRGEELALWGRLRANDAAAPPDLAAAYLDQLTDWLVRSNRGIDPDDCSTAAGDAIVALIKNPASYHPRRQSLWYFLKMSARGDLRNALAKERRRRAHLVPVPLEDVEVSPALGKYVVDEAADPARVVEWAEELAARRSAREARPSDARRPLTPEEEQVQDLMDEKERRTEAYARVLGLTHLPIEVQRREVKKVKDRLKKQRERGGRS